MRHLSKVFFLSIMAAGLLACSNEDEPATDNNPINAEKVYMQFKLEVPSSRSRSATDETGTPSNANPVFEVGTDSENTISDIQLVLVDNSNKIIAKSLQNQSLMGAGKDMYIVSFNSADLIAKAQAGAATSIKVIAYCNTTTLLTDQLTLTEVCQDATKTWATNHFWMTNANDRDLHCTLPSKEDLAKYNSADQPYVIGAIEVERIAARFDIAKGTENLEFPMMVDDKEVMKIVLTDVAMFNIKNDVNYLRRVSTDGTNPTGIEGMFGKETPTNYVVDAEGDNLSATKGVQLQWKSIADITQSDNWTGTGGEPEYYPWRYGVENTFSRNEEQSKSKATGVAFKGKLVAGAACTVDLQTTLATGEKAIYVFSDILYGDWDRVGRAANQGYVNGTDGDTFKPNSVLKAAYDAAQNMITVDSKTEVEAAKAAGFKVFEPKEKVYNVYYNYYNKHNDNGNPDVSGPMEYAVVRNNVYKLKVSSISKYGSPEWETPGTDPIEKDEIFFKVTVKILPWTVRVNNIEF